MLLRFCNNMYGTCVDDLCMYVEQPHIFDIFIKTFHAETDIDWFSTEYTTHINIDSVLKLNEEWKGKNQPVRVYHHRLTPRSCTNCSTNFLYWAQWILEIFNSRNMCNLCSAYEKDQPKGINRIHNVSNKVDTGHERNDNIIIPFAGNCWWAGVGPFLL